MNLGDDGGKLPDFLKGILGNTPEAKKLTPEELEKKAIEAIKIQEVIVGADPKVLYSVLTTIAMLDCGFADLLMDVLNQVLHQSHSPMGKVIEQFKAELIKRIKEGGK